MTGRLLGVLLLAALPAAADLDDLQDMVGELTRHNVEIAAAEPAQRERLKPEHDRLVEGVRAFGDARPRDAAVQLNVSQGFLTADEPAEAASFADRAVAVAQQKGDARTLGTALTLGALAYQKTGDYENAFARSKRALELDPSNKTATGIYQMSKGRSSGAARREASGGSPASLPTSPAPAARPSTAAESSGSGRSSFLSAAPDSPAPASSPFVGSETEKALKLTAEAGRRWSLDKTTALRLLDDAVAADARNAAARAARARARLEMGDAAGALEDADATLANGPSAAGRALKGEALLALGRKSAEVLAEFEAAAQLDAGYSARYQELIARAREGTGAQAPDLSRSMGTEEARPRPWRLVFAASGLAALAVIGWLLLTRRRDESDV